MLPYKLNVFISSTIYDLPNEREAALLAVKEFGANPIMSEYTINAQNANSVDTCLSKVGSSHVYVLILGGRYGWQPNGDHSITELEYLAAQEKNIPILVFNTTCEKEELQHQFSKRVGATFFWKTVNNAFELKDAIKAALKEEVEKWAKEIKENTELLYANLLNIEFPRTLYVADLSIDRTDVIQKSKESTKWLKKSASWYDVTVSAIHQLNIKFPHDWVCDEKKLITFHDLSDHSLPLAKLIDLGTVTALSCDEFYTQSEAKMRVFKSLLRNCVKTKLHKLGIRWFKNEKLFAFMPVAKDSLGRWKNRDITWFRKKTATRAVAKCIYKKNSPLEIKNIWHLAFATDFYFIDSNWYMSVKPDWVITYGDFKVSRFAFDLISQQKRNEKNMHVFNHLNFILWYLQPEDSATMYNEMEDYKFLKIKSFQTVEAYPIVPDDKWRDLESGNAKKNLEITETIDLFNNEV